jgi:hypothetical protein
MWRWKWYKHVHGERKIFFMKHTSYSFNISSKNATFIPTWHFLFNILIFFIPIYFSIKFFNVIIFFYKSSPGISDFLTNKMNCELMLTYDTPALRQTGSRNLMGQKTLPTIWGTYMKLVTKYQIFAINSCWEKCDEKYLGRTEGRTDRGKTVCPPPPLGSRDIIKQLYYSFIFIYFYLTNPWNSLEKKFVTQNVLHSWHF